MSAHSFSLHILIEDPKEVEIIDKWLGLVLQKGVHVLVIDIYLLIEPPQIYRLPNIHLSASLLTSLTLHMFNLTSSLVIDGVKFKSLKRLQHESVLVDEKIFKYLTSSCHLLEEFNVLCCYGFKVFGVYGHQNLQKVQIHYDEQVERIDIDTMNLIYLLGRGAPSMNLTSCKKLTTLSYNGYRFNQFSSDNPFTESSFLTHLKKSKILLDLSNFPFIENLFLTIPKTCKKIQVVKSFLENICTTFEM